MAKREKKAFHIPPVRVNETQLMGLAEMAAETDESISEHVRHAIDQYLLIRSHVRSINDRRFNNKG